MAGRAPREEGWGVGERRACAEESECESESESESEIEMLLLAVARVKKWQTKLDDA